MNLILEIMYILDLKPENFEKVLVIHYFEVYS
jgi:hypothetical protein